MVKVVFHPDLRLSASGIGAGTSSWTTGGGATLRRPVPAFTVVKCGVSGHIVQLGLGGRRVVRALTTSHRPTPSTVGTVVDALALMRMLLVV